MKFLSPEVALYLYISTIPYAHVWNTVVTFGLVPLVATWKDKLQKRICRTIGPSLAELASELESDLRDKVDWGKKWLVDFNAGKTQLVLFDRSNNNGFIDVKMDGSVLEEKSSF